MSAVSFGSFQASTKEQCGMTCAEFDPLQALLWVGDSNGYIRSLKQKTPTEYQRFLSWRAFQKGCTTLQVAGAVEEDLRLLVSSRSELRIYRTAGTMLHTFPFQNLLCDNITCSLMDNQTAPRRLFFGGEPKTICSVDCHTWEIVKEVPTTSITTVIRRCRSQILTGTGTGVVSVREPNTLNEILRIGAFGRGGVVTDAACRSGYIAVTGMHGFTFSENLKIFDIRKATEPAVKVKFDSPARYVAPHPTDETCMLAATNDGVYYVDIARGSVELSNSYLFPASNSKRDITLLTVSPSGEVICVGDTTGKCHVWNSTEHGRINATSFLFDTVPNPYNKCGHQRTTYMDLCTAMETVPPATDFYSSNWPGESYVILTNPPPREIDPKFFPLIPGKQTTLPNPGIHHAFQALLPQPSYPNPYPHNEQLNTTDLRLSNVAAQLKYLRNPIPPKSSDDMSHPFEFQEFDGTYYEGQNSDLLNQCPAVTGLENILPESWMNSLIQALYHVFAPQWPLRRAILNHWCRRRNCCACELAMLFHNMQAHASADCGPRCLPVAHIFRTLRQLDAFQAANLFRGTISQEDSIHMMHDALFTMLHTLHAELNVHESARFHGCAPQGDIVTECFGVQWEVTSLKRPRFVWNVPPTCKSVEEGLQRAFAEHSDIQNLPPIVALTLNRGPREDASLEPPEILTFTKQKGSPAVYTLMCKIILVYDEHFVCIVRTSNEKESWVLINDHIAIPVASERALYTQDLGITVIAFYCCDGYSGKRRSDVKVFNLTSVMKLIDGDDTPKKERWPSTIGKALSTPASRSLSANIPEGTLVAIDAEYILLDLGRLRVAKPPMSLARVSCVLGTTQDCFMDDYIAVSETVQDYVTRYSGIHPGDLSVETSTKTLTTLKSCWTKLKVLVAAGCRFIGHGLAQDLRVMHIVIPQSQLLDTVEIYRIAGQRKISLKFLMYYVFSETVQVAEHDSIEDARFALRLYLMYKDLQKQWGASADGKWETYLHELYLKGNELNWSIPANVSPVPPS